MDALVLDVGDSRIEAALAHAVRSPPYAAYAIVKAIFAGLGLGPEFETKVLEAAISAGTNRA